MPDIVRLINYIIGFVLGRKFINCNTKLRMVGLHCYNDIKPLLESDGRYSCVHIISIVSSN